MGRTLGDIPALIAKREAFTIGNMYARVHAAGHNGSPYRGWNAVDWPRNGCTYIVYSYQTPIAWIDEFGRAIHTRQHFSNTTSRHIGYTYTLESDPKIRGRKRDRDRLDREADERWRQYLQDKADRRREDAKRARQRRYWTPERLAARQLRDRASEVADLYGIGKREALRMLTQAPEETSIEEVIASLTGTRATRDARNSDESLTHA